MAATTIDQIPGLLSKIYTPDNDRNAMISDNISIMRIIELVTQPLLERINNLESSLGKTINGEFGDVVLTKDDVIYFGRYDDNGCKLIANYSSINSFEEETTEIYITSSSGYTPIGLVVIPSPHNVYNKCGLPGIMGLQYATLSGPGAKTSLYWGKFNDIPSLYNFKYVNHIDINTGKFDSANISGYLPSDKFSNILSLDGFSKYYYSDSSNYLPSPYLSDYSRNSVYSNEGCVENALSDFNGYRNTKQILGTYDNGTDNIISDYSCTLSNTLDKYPAFAACRKYGYSISVTTADQWYLPGLGELGYLVVRQKEINEYLSKISTTFGVTVQSIDSSNYHWSSTEYNSNNSWNINFNNGNTNCNNKNNNNYVRPFLWLA
jgi:hypothetical protein